MRPLDPRPPGWHGAAIVKARHSKWLAATALGFVIVVGDAVDDAAARRRPHSTLVARIRGRRFRSPGRLVFGGHAQSEVADLIEVGGGTKPPLRLGALLRSMAAACITPPDLETLPFPMTFTCNGNYTEYRLGHVELTKQWSTDTGLRMTITSFDGTRVRGTLTGTFDIPPPGEVPAALENGRFNAPIVVSTGG